MSKSGHMACVCIDPDGAVCTPLRVEPLDGAMGTDIATGFKALGDPHRVAILHLLAVVGQPVCVVDIERHIDLAQSTISHHLKSLVEAGVLRREPQGRWSYYSIVDERIAQLAAGLGELTGTPIGS